VPTDSGKPDGKLVGHGVWHAINHVGMAAVARAGGFVWGDGGEIENTRMKSQVLNAQTASARGKKKEGGVWSPRPKKHTPFNPQNKKVRTLSHHPSTPHTLLLLLSPLTLS